jgi:hypothetical protein
MANRIDYERRPKMDFESARALAWDKYLTLHPKEMWPEWLPRCVVFSGTSDKSNHWVISLTAAPKEPLGPNQYWEEANGRKYLVRIHPETGKKAYIIHRTPREVITVFKASIDPETAEVTVLIDMDFSSLTPEELEGY